jgi:hypothetical protein
MTPTKKVSPVNRLKHSELNGHYFVTGVISIFRGHASMVVFFDFFNINVEAMCLDDFLSTG